MKHFVKILLVIVLCFVPVVGQAKETPMWEGVKKTTSQQAADKAFLRHMKKLTRGNMAVGARNAIKKGWQFVAKRNPDMAIKRFNQAWLMKPNNPNIHWGFAIATFMQGAPLSVVEKHFKKAERRLKKAALYSDHGRILGERKKYKKAIIYFKKSLAINPRHRDGHAGMWMASKALGDKATAKKHRKLM